jgi:hypothetical protein
MTEGLIAIALVLLLMAGVLLARVYLARKKKRLRALARAEQEKQRLAVTTDPRKRAKIIERNM